MLRIDIERDPMLSRSGRPAWIDLTVQGMGRLAHLEHDWDSYGAPRIDPMVIRSALQLLFNVMRENSPPPSIVPTSSGGLQLEWHVNDADLEVEFLSPARVHGFFEDRSNKSQWEHDLSYDLGPLTRAIAGLS